MPQYWVFLCNPDRWSLDRFLADGHLEGNWRAGNYARKIKRGDIVLFRVGKGHTGHYPSGIYGVCKVIKTNCVGFEGTDPYWSSPDLRNSKEETVKLRFELLTKPGLHIGIDEIKNSGKIAKEEFWEPRGVGHFQIDEVEYDSVISLLEPRLYVP